MNSFIETLNQWGGNFSSFAWPMLWQSSLLIAVLFTFDLMLRRKLRASIRYALWLVVLVKLCVPPTLALPTSPAWWLHQTPSPAVAKPAPHYTVTYDDAPLQPYVALPTVALPALPLPRLELVGWALAVSVAVSVGLLLWLALRWWQVARIVRRATATEQFSEALDDALRLTGVPSVRLKIVEGRMSPAVCGLFRPVILLPRSLAEKLSAGQLRAVLLHELIHLRRRDVWVNFLQALLQIFYWWHPLLWVANARIRRVREEAVDDAVMLALRDDADHYAPTLLEVAKLALNRPLVSLGLVGIMESRHALRQRIERLVDFRAPRHAGLTLVSLLGILAFTAVAVPMGEGPARKEKETAPAIVSATRPVADSTNAAEANLFSRTNVIWEKLKAVQLVTDGKLLFEMGKLDDAEIKLKDALALDSEDATAKYYLGAVQTVRQAMSVRQKIIAKLDRIRLAKISFEHVTLEEVVRQLNEAARQNDPEKTGVSIITATNSVSNPLADTNSVLISMNLDDVRLADVLDAVVQVADKPIKYSILDSGVAFAVKDPADSKLFFTRTFKVDTNTFYSALNSGLKMMGDTNASPVINSPAMVSVSVRKFFINLGVNIDSPPGKSVFFEDSRGLLLVRATQSDLDTIEKAIAILNQVAPQIHIKARYIRVPKGTMTGFQTFQRLTNTVNGGFTGILSDTNARAVLRALESQKGVEVLGEPELVTTSGRQAQVRATQVVKIFTNLTVLSFQENGTNWSISSQAQEVETGPILDVVPYVMADGYTINLALIPSLTEFLGYDKSTNTTAVYNLVGGKIDVPKILPRFTVRQMVTTVNLWDNQTAIIGGMPETTHVNGSAFMNKPKASDKELLVFITATILDPAGNRVHTDDELPFAQKGVPPQPSSAK